MIHIMIQGPWHRNDKFQRALSLGTFGNLKAADELFLKIAGTVGVVLFFNLRAYLTFVFRIGYPF